MASNTACSVPMSPTTSRDRDSIEKKYRSLAAVNSQALGTLHYYSTEKKMGFSRKFFEIASILQDSYRPVSRYLNDVLNMPLEDISRPFEKLFFEKIEWDSYSFQMNREISLQLSFSEGLWEGICEELKIFVSSADSEECIRDFQEEFYVLWEEYANEDDENLTADARELKYKILALVKGVEFAGENK